MNRLNNERRQKGFTLIELLVSLAITGALGGIIVSSSFAMMKASQSTNSRAQLAIEVSKSTRWLARDIHKAGSSDIVDLAPAVTTAGFTWIDGGAVSTCTYSLNGVDGSFERACPASTIKIARGVSALQFTRSGDLVSVHYVITSPVDPSVTENIELLVMVGGG